MKCKFDAQRCSTKSNIQIDQPTLVGCDLDVDDFPSYASENEWKKLCVSVCVCENLCIYLIFSAFALNEWFESFTSAETYPLHRCSWNMRVMKIWTRNSTELPHISLNVGCFLSEMVVSLLCASFILSQTRCLKIWHIFHCCFAQSIQFRWTHTQCVLHPVKCHYIFDHYIELKIHSFLHGRTTLVWSFNRQQRRGGNERQRGRERRYQRLRLDAFSLQAITDLLE